MSKRNSFTFLLFFISFLISSQSVQAAMCGVDNSGSCEIACKTGQGSISDPTNKCTGFSAGGTVCCSPASYSEWPSAQCYALGGAMATNCDDLPNTFDAGAHLTVDCSTSGRCCLPSGKFNSSNPLPKPQACSAQNCVGSVPGAECLVACSGGKTPAAGICGAGTQCCIPGGGGTCQSKGGVCVSGTCSSENRQANPDGGSCVDADAGKTCCSATTTSAPTLSRGAFDYTLLEEIPNSTGTSGDFSSYLQSLYKFTFWAIGIAALFMLTVGGFMYITSAGNTSRIGTAKTIIVDSILGIIIALFAWLFLYVLNPDLVENLSLPTTTGGVGAGGTSTGGTTGGTSTGGTSTGGSSCTDPQAFKASLASGGSVCSGQCNRQLCSFSAAVNNAIDTVVAQNPGVDKRIIKAIICKESSGNPNAGPSVAGACGLMQIVNPDPNSNWKNGCPASILDPVENIRQGIALYKQKLSAVSGLNYGGKITTNQMAFAAYNCCGGGENPNSQSASCATSDGWPSLPKWACPIDPGTGTFNMCTVKSYACEIEACALRY